MRAIEMKSYRQEVLRAKAYKAAGLKADWSDLKSIWHRRQGWRKRFRLFEVAMGWRKR